MEIVYKTAGRTLTPEEFRGDSDSARNRFEDMIAAARPPMSNTDREFLQGHCNGNQFEGREAEGDYYRAVAAQGGVSTQGKVYLSGLARFPGDPEAWVGSKGDAQAVIEKNGWGCTGLISRPVTNIAEPSKPTLDMQLVIDETEQIIEERVPSDERDLVDRNDLAEQVWERRKPSWVDESFPGLPEPGQAEGN